METYVGSLCSALERAGDEWDKWTAVMIRLFLSVSAKEASGAGVEKQTPGKDRRDFEGLKSWPSRAKDGGGGHQGGDGAILFKLEWEKYRALLQLRGGKKYQVERVRHQQQQMENVHQEEHRGREKKAPA